LSLKPKEMIHHRATVQRAAAAAAGNQLQRLQLI
jgi:hypothetical protein